MDRQFGNYILHERIGIGGMGEVFRATKLGPGKFEVQVALKVILPHLAREEPFRDRFSREARLAASLKHPNIVQVNGFDIIDETPFIEMEYVPGADLRLILRTLDEGDRLSLEETASVLYAVARGLTHAHQHESPGSMDGRIVHCDLNPHNILISRLGEVKVADFGIARALQGDVSNSATVRGKLAYMSPEQMEGRKLDQRTDLFSLGIIAYQLLSGKHPFERGSEAATIAAIGKGEHLPLREAAPELPQALYDLVDKLLSPDPSSRPDSTSTVLETLEPMVLPSAATSLARRVSSFSSSPSTSGIAVVKGESSTALTLARSRISRIWPYLLTGAILSVLAAAVFLLPTGLEPHRSQATNITTPEKQPAADPPSKPEPPPAIASVTVISRPQGALISAGGKQLGRTPLEVPVESGSEDPPFKAALYGYRNETFSISNGSTDPLVVTLVPLPTGTVRISARPWAAVSFRGKDVGATPVVIQDVPVGRHIFTLSYAPLSVEKDLTVEVKEGMNTFSVDMREDQ